MNITCSLKFRAGFLEGFGHFHLLISAFACLCVYVCVHFCVSVYVYILLCGRVGVYTGVFLLVWVWF